jgi:hypothetical protein
MAGPLREGNGCRNAGQFRLIINLVVEADLKELTGAGSQSERAFNGDDYRSG